MKNALKILCIIFAITMLCSCSKMALDNNPDKTPGSSTEGTPPPSVDTESGAGTVTHPDDTTAPPAVVAFRTYNDYADIFSVINGNADITYGIYPEEAQQADGSATVVSANGLTAPKYTLSPSDSDGKYIYTVNRGTLFVCDKKGIVSDTFLFTNDFETERGGNITYGYENTESVFLREDTLIVVSSMFSYNSAGKEISKVNVYFCDVSDPKAPRVDRTVSQDGRFITATVCGKTLYAVSSHMINSAVENDITTYVPHTYAPASAPIAAENIRVFEYSTCAGYTVVAGYDIKNGTLTGSAAALGGTGRLYTDNTDIYMAFFSEASEETAKYTEGAKEIEEFTTHCMTAVLKFPMTPELSTHSEALVDGCFMGDFSIYSKDGTLYLCTIAERSTYSIYTDKNTGWSERRDISAEISNMLYSMSADLSEISAVTLPDDVVFSARFAENYVWVGYFSEELCFELGSGSEADLPAISSCCVAYTDEDYLLGVSRTDSETLTFTLYNAEDFSVVSETALTIPTSFLNSSSVTVHHSGIITFSAGANGHCAVRYNGEAFELAASVPAIGWVHCIATDDELFVISDSVTVLDLTDLSKISTFKLEAQSGAVG